MGKIESLVNESNVKLALYLQILSAAILIVGAICLGDFTNSKTGSSFIHFGPGNAQIPIDIFGFNIDTWKKWSILILFLVSSEVINTFATKIYNNWYKNIVADPKSASVGMNQKDALLVINSWDTATWVSRIFKWMIFILTKQLQFMLPQFLAYLFVSNKINHNYIYSKNPRKNSMAKQSSSFPAF